MAVLEDMTKLLTEGKSDIIDETSFGFARVNFDSEAKKPLCYGHWIKKYRLSDPWEI